MKSAHFTNSRQKRQGGFMKAQYITATEVAEIMGISRSKSYQIVRQLNKELKAQGYLTVAGKCPIHTIFLLKTRQMCYTVSGDENEEIRDNY